MTLVPFPLNAARRQANMNHAISKIRKSVAAALMPVAVFAIWIWTWPAAQAAPTPAPAATTKPKLSELGTKMGYNTEGKPDPIKLAGDIIGTALTMIGIVFTVLMIYAGYLWMTAQGNEEQIGKAKKIIINSVIGIIITALAYTISSFVLTALPKGT
jgi:uncharacterized membrane protein YwzB